MNEKHFKETSGKDVIHILGPSGSGTTTLGRLLAEEIGSEHLDTDSIFWELTDPPFQLKRPVEQREQMLVEQIDRAGSVVLSGSLCGWGDLVIPRFAVVIFLSLPTPTRLERLERRQEMEFGDRVRPGGDMHQTHLDFMEWAAAYDNGGPDMRSRQMHEVWLERLEVPVLRIDLDEEMSPGDVMGVVREWIGGDARSTAVS